MKWINENQVLFFSIFSATGFWSKAGCWSQIFCLQIMIRSTFCCSGCSLSILTPLPVIFRFQSTYLWAESFAFHMPLGRVFTVHVSLGGMFCSQHAPWPGFMKKNSQISRGFSRTALQYGTELYRVHWTVGAVLHSLQIACSGNLIIRQVFFSALSLISPLCQFADIL